MKVLQALFAVGALLVSNAVAATPASSVTTLTSKATPLEAKRLELERQYAHAYRALQRLSSQQASLLAQVKSAKTSWENQPTIAFLPSIYETKWATKRLLDRARHALAKNQKATNEARLQVELLRKRIESNEIAQRRRAGIFHPISRDSLEGLAD